jgi:hypothetical protein
MSFGKEGSMAIMIILGIIAIGVVVALIAMSRDFEQPIWEIFGKSQK